MFGVPIEKVTKGSDLRQRGKTAELALGYEGSVNAMEKMDKEKKLSKKEMYSIVALWRRANPKIVEFWACLLYTSIRRIGIDGNFIHVDASKTLPQDTIWTY